MNSGASLSAEHAAAPGKVRPLACPQIVEIARSESCTATHEPILAEQSVSLNCAAPAHTEKPDKSGLPAIPKPLLHRKRSALISIAVHRASELP
jgi:hypothetical protein